MNAAEKLVDWAQLADLMGDVSDLTQRPMLAGMWQDMVSDLERELGALAGLATDDEARAALHRLRGVVSMWGLRVVADRMQAIERATSPLETWRSQRAEIVAMAELSRLEIVKRQSWLGET